MSMIASLLRPNTRAVRLGLGLGLAAWLALCAWAEAQAAAHHQAVCGKDLSCDPTHPYLNLWQALPAPEFPVWRRVIRMQASETIQDIPADQGAGTTHTRHYTAEVITLNRSAALYQDLVQSLGRENVDPQLKDHRPSSLNTASLSIHEPGQARPALVKFQAQVVRALPTPEAERMACPTGRRALPCVDADRPDPSLKGVAISLVREETLSAAWAQGRPLVHVLMQAALEAANWQVPMRGTRLFTGPSERGPNFQEKSRQIFPASGGNPPGQRIEMTRLWPANQMVVDSQTGNGGGMVVSWSEAVADDSVRAVHYQVSAWPERPDQWLLRTFHVCARGQAASGLCL